MPLVLADVPDPRRAQGKRYPLPYLLLFTVLGLLSGARSYRGIITFLGSGTSAKAARRLENGAMAPSIKVPAIDSDFSLQG